MRDREGEEEEDRTETYNRKKKKVWHFSADPDMLRVTDAAVYCILFWIFLL